MIHELRLFCIELLIYIPVHTGGELKYRLYPRNVKFANVIASDKSFCQSYTISPHYLLYLTKQWCIAHILYNDYHNSILLEWYFLKFFMPPWADLSWSLGGHLKSIRDRIEMVTKCGIRGFIFWSLSPWLSPVC